jgi:hypothetical protein
MTEKKKFHFAPLLPTNQRNCAATEVYEWLDRGERERFGCSPTYVLVEVGCWSYTWKIKKKIKSQEEVKHGNLLKKVKKKIKK